MAREVVTPDDLSPVIEISIWFCLVLLLLTLLIRYAIKLWVIRHFNLDDYLTSLSAVCATIQSVLLWIATSNGLGQRSDSLTDEQTETMLQFQYAAQILFVASMAFSKLGLLAYLRNLSRSKQNRTWCLVLCITIGIWALSSILTIAFECGLPNPWDIINGHCSNLAAIAAYQAVLNMITDLILTLQPIFIIQRLNVSLRKRCVVGTAFAARAIVIALIALQLAYTEAALSSGDPTFDAWRAAVPGQLAQALSIITASTVYLKPFLDSLQSGFLQAGDMRRRQASGFGFSAEASSHNKPWSRGRFGWGRSSKRDYPSDTAQYSEIELQRPKAAAATRGENGLGYSASAAAPRAERAEGAEHPEETGRLQIMQTRTWVVEEG